MDFHLLTTAASANAQLPGTRVNHHWIHRQVHMPTYCHSPRKI